MDIEREIVATVTDVDACKAYQAAGITKSLFADSRYADVFDFAMSYFRGHGKMVSAPTSEIMAAEFQDYAQMVEGTSGAAPSYLADKIKGRFATRQVQDAIHAIVPNLSSSPIEVASYLRDVMAGVVDITSSADSCIEYGKDMEDYRQRVNERDSRNGAPYPWPEMQQWTGGIKPGEMAILVGPSGMGKSNVACKTALEAVRQGWNVYFATLELEPMAIAQRIEFMEVNHDGPNVPINSWMGGARLPQYIQAMNDAQDRIAGMAGKLVIDQPRVENRTPTALVQACKSHGCNFLIVDQLQFVTKPQRENMAEAVGLVMQEFKQQLMSPADNIRIPMLLLHQMNRVGVKTQENGTGRIGSMADIAHSSWVEQLSDVVWGIGRNREEANVGVMNIATLKARSFQRVGWRLNWDTDWFYFDIQRDDSGRAIGLEDW